MKRKKSTVSLIALLLCIALSVSSIPAAAVMAEEQVQAGAEQEASDPLSEAADEELSNEDSDRSSEEAGTESSLNEEEESPDNAVDNDLEGNSAGTGETAVAAEEESGSEGESDETEAGLEGAGADEEAGENGQTDNLTSEVEEDESDGDNDLTSEVEVVQEGPIGTSEAAATDSTAAAAAEELLKEKGKKEAEATTSGNCGASGDNVKWKYTSGTLTITGSGEMDDWNRPGNFWGNSGFVPWLDYADKITKVVIGEGVTYIGSCAFAETKITSVTLPSSMKEIGQLAFAYCSNLKSVKLNEGLEQIGYMAFSGTALTQLTIPSSVTKIDNTVFDDIGVSNLKFAGSGSEYSTYDGFVFRDGGKTLVYSPRDKSGTYKIPSGVTKIDNSAFRSAKWEKVTLPAGLKEICSEAFSYTSIKSIVIPDTVERIGFGAFMASGLQEIIIPSSVKEMGTSVFSDCDSLVKARIDCDLAIAGDSLFFRDEALKTVTFNGKVTMIPDYTFAGCISLQNFAIPKTVKSIGEQAFNGCTSLTSVSFGSSLESIGEAAFYDTGIKKVTIPASVKDIGISAFPEDCVVCSNENLITDNYGNYVSSDILTSIDIKVVYGQTEARSMLSMINAFRQSSDAWYYDVNGKKIYQKNLAPLKYDYDLEKIAMQRAAELAIRYDEKHLRPDGASFYTEVVNEKFAIAENASCKRTAKEAFVSLQETDSGYGGQGHRRTMLADDLTCIGIGHIYYNGRHYWVQEFGAWDDINTKTTVAEDTEKTVNMPVSNEYFDSSCVSVSPASYLLDVNGTATLPKPSTNKKVLGGITLRSFPTIVWKSQDTGVAKIQGGKLVGVAAGSTYITASVYGGTKKVKVVVGKLSTPKLTGTVNNSKGIVVKWGKVAGAVNYRVYRKSGTAGWTAVGTTTGTSYLDQTAKRGVKYTYTVCTVTADGRYKTSDFNKTGVAGYRLSPVQITALKNTVAGKLYVSWAKNGACSGYQIQYASNKNFTGAKSVTVKNKESLSRTLMGLTKGRRYFVRVRTFKTISGSNFYSVWSTVKSLKLTK